MYVYIILWYWCRDGTTNRLRWKDKLHQSLLFASLLTQELLQEGGLLWGALMDNLCFCWHLRTWLCLHVYLRWVRVVLLPTRMGLSIAGVLQRKHNGSFPSHSCWFVGEGSTSYVALKMKLILLDSVLQTSLHVRCFLSTTSHLTQRPWLACFMALERVAASSGWRTSSTTIRCKWTERCHCSKVKASSAPFGHCSHCILTWKKENSCDSGTLLPCF